jgi:hypothetical protein
MPIILLHPPIQPFTIKNNTNGTNTHDFGAANTNITTPTTTPFVGLFNRTIEKELEEKEEISSTTTKIAIDPTPHFALIKAIKPTRSIRLRDAKVNNPAPILKHSNRLISHDAPSNNVDAFDDYAPSSTPGLVIAPFIFAALALVLCMLIVTVILRRRRDVKTPMFRRSDAVCLIDDGSVFSERSEFFSFCSARSRNSVNSMSSMSEFNV